MFAHLLCKSKTGMFFHNWYTVNLISYNIIDFLLFVIYEKACQEKIMFLLTKKQRNCFLAMRPSRLIGANQAIKVSSA